ncbi:MAG TPA: GatB/YqeY domain-containing protein [Micropruina sp.]|mgnify:CR=1 FL=1|jgi:uncharacterized protein YqeY|nr:GatB/YqeY domain-containing protein [Micropruina sp.]
MPDESAPLRHALRDALPGAMKSGDTPGRNAIRAALAAIENAESVPSDQNVTRAATSEHIAGAVVGLGAAEVQRRELTEEQTLEIVSAERDERLAAAAQYRAAGQAERAAQLEAEALALDSFLC